MNMTYGTANPPLPAFFWHTLVPHPQGGFHIIILRYQFQASNQPLLSVRFRPIPADFDGRRGTDRPTLPPPSIDVQDKLLFIDIEIDQRTVIEIDVDGV
jgi:hypothetical protein